MRTRQALLMRDDRHMPGALEVFGQPLEPCGSVRGRLKIQDVEVVRNHIDRRDAAAGHIAVLFLRVIVLAQSDPMLCDRPP